MKSKSLSNCVKVLLDKQFFNMRDVTVFVKKHLQNSGQLLMIEIIKFARWHVLLRFISWIFMIIGASFLLYGGYHLYDSHLKEEKRLEEAKSIISEEVIPAVEGMEELTSVYKTIQTGDTIGLFSIPRLDRESPIIEGPDEEELAEGVGHYKDTGLPGEHKQILLSGHRDTVFRQFGELEDGDELHIKMQHG